MRFIRSLKRLFQGNHVAHNLNPFISIDTEWSPSPRNRTERREERKQLKRKGWVK